MSSARIFNDDVVKHLDLLQGNALFFHCSETDQQVIQHHVYLFLGWIYNFFLFTTAPIFLFPRLLCNITLVWGFHASLRHI